MRFGRIEPGYTASLTVLNLARPTTVRREDLEDKMRLVALRGAHLPRLGRSGLLRGRHGVVCPRRVQNADGAFDHLEAACGEDWTASGYASHSASNTRAAKRLGGIPLEHGDGLLHDDGPVIVEIIREMNRAAADLDPAPRTARWTLIP